MSDEKITVLVVEPMKDAYTKEICGLKEMQELVGGYIQIVPLSDTEPVLAVMNEEGKLLDLPYNRALTDENGIPYDIICGTFFIASEDGEDIGSLTEDQIRRYKEKYDNEILFTVQETEKPKHSNKEKHHHER